MAGMHLNKGETGELQTDLGRRDDAEIKEQKTDEKAVLEAKTLTSLKRRLAINPEELMQKLMAFITEYEKKLQREGVIFGLSGGLDSAVVAKLCVKAVGTEQTFALLMPEKDSAPKHLHDAQELAKSLGIDSKLVELTGYLKAVGIYRLFPLDALIPKSLRTRAVNSLYHYYEKKRGTKYFFRTLGGSDQGLTGNIVNRSHAYYRAKHRMRMLILYLYAERDNRLVVGAANKTEAKVGFFVKHGVDDATDIMPILGLYKTQVFELARYLQVPEAIIKKQPSPDLISGLMDEVAIGMSYEKLDLILVGIEAGWSEEEIVGALSEIGVSLHDVHDVQKMCLESEHMRTVYIAD